MRTHSSRRISAVVAAVVAAVGGIASLSQASGASVQAPAPDVQLHRLSSDPFTNASSQHHTEVEPGAFAFGNTIVTAFQVGRFTGGGGSAIGWATSTDGGRTWAHGFLPGVTTYVGGGTYESASDPSVAYDARHNVWMVSELGLINPAGSNANPPAPTAPVVLASRSTDGGVTWQAPTTIAAGTNWDKNWTTCDNTSASPYYGNCYTEYDDSTSTNAFTVAVSSDGGTTWNPSTVPVAAVLGSQPVVQPTGTVIVPIRANGGPSNQTESFVSTDGGATFTGPNTIADTANDFHDPGTGNPNPSDKSGEIRAESLPSAGIDGAGRVYVVWPDCRFRTACSSNDIVLSTSTDGVTWSAPARIPIDPASSTVDHFIVGLGVDPTTSGATAHLALTYYYYPKSGCAPAECRLNVGFVASNDAGATWSAARQLAGPMPLSWLPTTTTLGRMVGDYVATPFVNHIPFPIFAVAHAPSNGSFDEAIYTTTSPQITEHTTFNCTLKSKANGRFVTAELAKRGAMHTSLQAAATTAGDWEHFQCVALPNGRWALRSRANTRYATVEVTDPEPLRGQLRARAAKVGARETLTLKSVASCSCFAIQAANHKFVTVDTNAPGSRKALLRARSSTVGQRQEFDITAR